MAEFRNRALLLAGAVTSIVAGGDPIMRALADAAQKKQAAAQLALRNAARAELDKLDAARSRQVRRAIARKAGKER